MNAFSPIVTKIEEITNAIPGWTPPDQLFALYMLALKTANSGGDILEVGSWCGRSTVVLALAAQLTGGKVQCVDLFPSKDDWKQNADGSWSFIAENTLAYGVQTVWDEPFQRDIAPLYKEHESVFDIFSSSLKKFGVERFVSHHKGTTKTFAKNCASPQYRMAFIDGDHSEKAVSDDIQFALAHLLPGGALCFDDAFSTYDGVDNAIKKEVIDTPRCMCSQQLTRKFHVAFMR